MYPDFHFSIYCPAISVTAKELLLADKLTNKASWLFFLHGEYNIDPTRIVHMEPGKTNIEVGKATGRLNNLFNIPKQMCDC